jgi:transcriptional regulator with XRE-family HTH domain
MTDPPAYLTDLVGADGGAHNPVMVLEGPALGRFLRRRRADIGLTQEALGERAGISARTVSDVERGLRSAVYRDTAERLADALGRGDSRRLDAGRRMKPARSWIALAAILLIASSRLALPARAAGTAIGFGKSLLGLASPQNPTSLQFGPDGRLYVAQADGTIEVYSIERNGPND